MVYKYDLLVIGGGAAGFFGAITAANQKPSLKIILLEKSTHLLAKVKVSGGSRCNVTHDLTDKKAFSEKYPRGGKHVFKLLHQLGVDDTVDWFRQRGVELKTEADGRMFPVTDRSQTIIDCLMREAASYGIEIRTSESVLEILREVDGFQVKTSSATIQTKNILIATGGHPKTEGFNWLADMGFKIEPPVPSLFTFNLPDHPLKDLMGVAQEVRISVDGTKLRETGPMLITHWGFSGPAILRASAWGARELAGLNYNFTVRINWMPELNPEDIREWLQKQRISSGKRLVVSRIFDSLTQRLWEALCSRAGINSEVKWAELPAKNFNRLIETITADAYHVKGKTTFKEEFVTCGGVSLNEIDSQTCESKKIPGIFFAGEVLHVDGITGGFNFQHAWSSGFVAGKAIGKKD